MHKFTVKNLNTEDTATLDVTDEVYDQFDNDERTGFLRLITTLRGENKDYVLPLVISANSNHPEDNPSGFKLADTEQSRDFFEVVAPGTRENGDTGFSMNDIEIEHEYIED